MKKILNWIAVVTVASSVGCATRLTTHEKQSLSSLTRSIEQQRVVVEESEAHLAKLADMKARSADDAEVQKANRDLEAQQRLLKKLEDRLAVERNQLLKKR